MIPKADNSCGIIHNRIIAEPLYVILNTPFMNKKYILHNLKDALKQLNETVYELENDSEYGYGDYVADMTHLYHHINTAWNAQNSLEQESEECSEENYREWRKFPQDINMAE